MRLSQKLDDFVSSSGIGEVNIAPLDVIFDDSNVLQPDIVFISNTNKHIIQKRGVFGSPDLLVEVLSPSTKDKDRGKKFKAYAKFGVKEYWIVDPDNKSTEVFSLEHNRYELFCSTKTEKSFSSKLLADIKISLDELFK